MIRKIIRQIIEESYQELLNEKVGDFNYNKTFDVPDDVALVAQEAMNSNGSNLEKAVELKDQKAQTFNQMRKLRDFFTANKDNKDKNWNLHGGDECRDWVERELSKFHDSNLKTKSNLRDAGGAGEKKGMGIFRTDLMDTRNTRNNIR